MNTIQQNWESYLKDVMPANASAIQKQECRRVFYASAQATMGIVCALGDDSVTEEAGAAILAGIEQELDAFADQIMAGKA